MLFRAEIYHSQTGSLLTIDFWSYDPRICQTIRVIEADAIGLVFLYTKKLDIIAVKNMASSSHLAPVN